MRGRQYPNNHHHYSSLSNIIRIRQRPTLITTTTSCCCCFLFLLRPSFLIATMAMTATAATATATATATTTTTFVSSKLPQNDSFNVQSTFDRLRSNPKEILLLDGGTGEELFRHGVPDDRKIWSATAIVKEQYHSILEQVHHSYLQAGSKAITTNSYGLIPGVGFTSNEILMYGKVAGQIARQAVTKQQQQQQINDDNEDTNNNNNKLSDTNDNNNNYYLVLGSLGPLVESYRADLIKPHNEGVLNYKIICKALSPYVDIYLAETMSCIEETAQVIQAIAELKKEEQEQQQQQQQQQEESSVETSSSSSSSSSLCPIMVSYTLDSNGNLRNGQSVDDGIQYLLQDVMQQPLHQQTVQCILFNCAEPEAITKGLNKIKLNKTLLQNLKNSNILLGAYPNRLTPVASDWTMDESNGPQPFRKDLLEQQYWEDFVSIWIHQYNVQLIGGCCGITPEHISYIHKQLS